MDPKIIVVVILVILSIIGGILGYVFSQDKTTTVAATATATPVLTDGGKASFLAHLKDDPESLTIIRDKLKNDPEFKSAFITSVVTDSSFGSKVLENADNSPGLKALLESMKTEILEKYNSLQSFVNAEDSNINASIIGKYNELKALITTNYDTINADILVKYLELKKLIEGNLLTVNAVILAKYNELKPLIEANLKTVNADILKKYNELKTLIESKSKNVNADILNKYNELKALIETNLKSANADTLQKYNDLKKYVTSESLITSENSTAGVKKYSMWCADGSYNCDIPSSATGINVGYKKSLSFGNDLESKEINAGKIGYGILTPNVDRLDIVGAGAVKGNRNVSIYDNLSVDNLFTAKEIGIGNFRIKSIEAPGGGKDLCFYDYDTVSKTYKKIFCIGGIGTTGHSLLTYTNKDGDIKNSAGITVGGNFEKNTTKTDKPLTLKYNDKEVASYK